MTRVQVFFLTLVENQYFIALLTIILLLMAGFLSNYMDYLVYSLIVVGGYLWLRQERYQLPKELRVLITLSFVFFALITFNIILNQNISLLFGFRYEIFRILLFLPFLIYIFYIMNFSEQMIWKIVVLGGFFTIFLSAYLIINPTERGTGLLSIPITRGNLGMLFGMLSFVAIFGLTSKKWQSLAVLTFITGVMLSVLSGSRGGWLSFFLGIFIVILINKKQSRKMFFGSVFLLVFLIMIVIFMWDNLPIASRMHLMVQDFQNYFNGNAHSSLGARFEMWKASFLIFLEHPIWGYGFNKFDDYYAIFAEQNLVIQPPQGGWGHAHSDYFSFLGEMGVVGLLSMLSIFIYPAYLFIKKIKSLGSTQHIYIPLAGLILIETIMEIMISDETVTEKFTFTAYIILLLLFITHREKVQ